MKILVLLGLFLSVGPCHANAAEDLLDTVIKKVKEENIAEQDAEKRREEKVREFERKQAEKKLALGQQKSKILSFDMEQRRQVLQELARTFVSKLKRFKENQNASVYRKHDSSQSIQQLMSIISTVSEPFSFHEVDESIIKKRNFYFYAAFTPLLTMASLAVYQVLDLPYLGFTATPDHALAVGMPVVFSAIIYRYFFKDNVDAQKRFIIDNDIMRSGLKTIWYPTDSDKIAVNFKTWMPFWDELKNQGIELPQNIWDYETFLRRLVVSSADEEVAKELVRIDTKIVDQIKCNNTLQMPADNAAEIASEQKAEIEQMESLVRQNMRMKAIEK